MSTDDRKPWEQRDDETDKAHAAFRQYAQMPTLERSIRKLREDLGRPKGYQRHLFKWSSQHDWVDRARAFDRHQDRDIEDARLRAKAAAAGVLLDPDNAKDAARTIVALTTGEDIPDDVDPATARYYMKLLDMEPADKKDVTVGSKDQAIEDLEEFLNSS